MPTSSPPTPPGESPSREDIARRLCPVEAQRLDEAVQALGRADQAQAEAARACERRAQDVAVASREVGARQSAWALTVEGENAAALGIGRAQAAVAEARARLDLALEARRAIIASPAVLYLEERSRLVRVREARQAEHLRAREAAQADGILLRLRGPDGLPVRDVTGGGVYEASPDSDPARLAELASRAEAYQGARGAVVACDLAAEAVGIVSVARDGDAIRSIYVCRVIERLQDESRAVEAEATRASTRLNDAEEASWETSRTMAGLIRRRQSMASAATALQQAHADLRRAVADLATAERTAGPLAEAADAARRHVLAARRALMAAARRRGLRPAAEVRRLQRERAARQAVRDPLVGRQPPSTARFGIEIEVVGVSPPAALSILGIALGGAAAGWTAVSDGSIEPPGSRPCCEVVSPPLRACDLPLVLRVVRALRDHGCESSPEHRCGIHVHVSHPTLDSRLPAVVRKVVDVASKVLPASAGRKRYCRDLPESFLSRLRDGMTRAQVLSAWYAAFPDRSRSRNDKYHASRYHAVNLHSVAYRGTVELRWFDGTLDEGRIATAIRTALEIATR